MHTKDKPPEATDPVIDALKQRYFKVAAKEDFPNTPMFTAEADRLEVAIRSLQWMNPT